MANQAISVPFSFNSSGSVDYSENLQKIWQDRVVLVVMTRLNEKVMRPTFGSGAGSVVFENLNDAITEIKQAITLAFSKWLADLTLIEVVGYEDPNENLLILEVTYRYNRETLDTVLIKTALINRSGEVILEVNNV
jgi:phage baseplate assembly protein W